MRFFHTKTAECRETLLQRIASCCRANIHCIQHTNNNQHILLFIPASVYHECLFHLIVKGKICITHIAHHFLINLTYITPRMACL